MNFDQLTTLTLRDWLLPPDRQPTQVFLDGAIDDVVTSLTFDDSALDVEEVALLTNGAVIEVDFELMYVTAVDTGNKTLDVRRGYLGTKEAEHADGATVTASPVYPRKRIFDALQGVVGELSPPLFQRGVELASSNPTPLPDEAFGIIDAVTDDGEPVPAKFLRYLPTYDSPGVKLGAGYSNATVLWKGLLTTPRKPTDTLSSCGIPEEWASLIALGAVARIFSAGDIDNAVASNVFDRVAVEGFPTGSAVQLARTLDQMFYQRIEQVRQAQRQQAPMRKTMNGWINR